MSIQYISRNSNSFPLQLKEISSPPKGLYLRGELRAAPMLAVVGTRLPTEYGRRVTYKICQDLARAGFCLVSGLAMGIDSVVHQAALDASGYTIAVLGSGPEKAYPRSNTALYNRILDQGGAILSEYDIGTVPHKSHFPARNRIISGLSMGVVVTEADAKSGSLITANFALQQNRTVMAVPGNITSPKSAGPNNLIKAGALPVSDSNDIIANLGLETPEMVSHKPKADSKEEALIIDLLSAEGMSTAQLIDKTGIDAINIASIISLMEITGKIRNIGAGIWVSA